MSLKKIVLKSTDGELFEVDEAMALQSRKIKHMIENGCGENDVIHLSNVTSEILTMVLDYCKKHTEEPNSDDDEMKNWDVDFVIVDQATLFELILAARYLEIRGMYYLTNRTVASMIRGKTVKELKKT